MRTYIFRFLPLVTVISTLAHANLVQPADGPYSTGRAHQSLFIFESSTAAFAGNVASYVGALRRDYDRSFRWRLDEEADFILASPNQQFANAFATISPNVKSFWWPSGVIDLENDGAAAWLPLIAIHETAHLYQLNSKGSFNAKLKRVFGNVAETTALIAPITIHPNVILPKALLEGNAVLNESRFGNGGRLFSGEVRALVLRLVAAGGVDASRLINDQFRFPFGEAAYVLGGYFQAHLAETYGVDRTNAFFVAHGNHWLNPLIINRTFRTHFGASFYSEVRAFTRALERLAEHQVTSTAAPVDRGIVLSPLNHDDARVFWLSSPGYRTPFVNVYDKRTGVLSSRPIDLPFSRPPGKLFADADEWLVTATTQRDLHHQTYSLYGERARFLPEFANQIVTDRRAGHAVSLDATKSWLDARILLDGAPFEVGNSNPVLDAAGNVYFFRQSGARRLLYRNHDLIARLDGYYAKLTEVDARGRVYFVGATPYGSTLYRFADGAIERVVDSDVVADARVIDDGRVLLTEVAAEGRRVVTEIQRPRAAVPAVYAYGFLNDASSMLTQIAPMPTSTSIDTSTADASVTAAPAAAVSTSAPAEPLQVGAYSSWRELRYAEGAFTTAYDTDAGLSLRAEASFADPLEYHSIDAHAYSGNARGGGVTYSFERYLFRPTVAYGYRRETYEDQIGSFAFVDQEFNLGFKLPLFRRERWQANLNVSSLIAREYNDLAGAVSRTTYGTSTSLGVTRLVPTINGLYPWRQRSLALMHRFSREDTRGERDEHAGSVSAGFDHGFRGQYHLNVAAQVAAATDQELEVGYSPFSFASRITVPQLSGARFRAQRAARLRIEGRRVLPLPRYDARLPIGLNRIGVIVAGQALTVDGAERRLANDGFEAGVGLDVDGLALHVLPFTTRVLTGITRTGADVRAFTQVTVAARRSF